MPKKYRIDAHKGLMFVDMMMDTNFEYRCIASWNDQKMVSIAPDLNNPDQSVILADQSVGDMFLAIEEYYPDLLDNIDDSELMES